MIFLSKSILEDDILGLQVIKGFLVKNKEYVKNFLLLITVLTYCYSDLPTTQIYTITLHDALPIIQPNHTRDETVHFLLSPLPGS